MLDQIQTYHQQLDPFLSRKAITTSPFPVPRTDGINILYSPDYPEIIDDKGTIVYQEFNLIHIWISPSRIRQECLEAIR